MLEKTLKKLLVISLLSLIIVVIIGVAVLSKGGEGNMGSVGISGEYRYATTLAPTTKASLIKYGRGTFGSVIVNAVGAGSVVLYDATSTIPLLRTIQATSSLPVVAVVSASQAVGTYTYDVSFYNGLIAVYDGVQGTSTLTYR